VLTSKPLRSPRLSKAGLPIQRERLVEIQLNLTVRPCIFNGVKTDFMKRISLTVAAVLLAITPRVIPQGSQPNPAPQAGAPSAKALTIPSGQKFILQLQTDIHTNTTHKGDRVEFRTAGDVLVDNRIAIPTQSWVGATVTMSKRAGRLAGRATVQLRFDQVRLPDGTAFPLQATIIRVGLNPVDAKNGQPSLKGEAGTAGNIGAVASTAGQGALIGLIAGGMKGAAYGGAIGAGVAAAGMILKRGPDLDLPRDTMLEARFDQPIEIPLTVAERTEQAQHSAQLARNQSGAPQSEVSPAAEPGAKTRPVLRRNAHAGQPSGETATNPPSPETASAGPPAEVPATEPPAEHPVTSTQPLDVPQPPPASGQPAAAAGDIHQASPGGFNLSVNVKMVLVDTVVRDRAGRIIDNLKREDFRLYEDGVEQQIQSYSRDQLPLAVALVVDHSGSVSPYIDELRRIANRALQQLKPGDKVALFSFARSVERVVDLTTDRQRIADGLTRIRAGGGTDIIDAIFDATTYLAKVAPDYRRAIILVSDNQGTVQPQVSEGETIRMAMETETVVYSLKTSGEATPLGMRLPSLLSGMGSVRKVAQETGGEVIDVGGVGMLDAALSTVISRLRLRYALGYYPTSQAQGGAFHTIEVRLIEHFGKPGSDYTVQARRGYYATGSATASRSGS
jgi:Ca-activated chloride channel family protein